MCTMLLCIINSWAWFYLYICGTSICKIYEYRAMKYLFHYITQKKGIGIP